MKVSADEVFDDLVAWREKIRELNAKARRVFSVNVAYIASKA